MIQKILDDKPYRPVRPGLLRLGHGHMELAQGPAFPQITGGEAAAITQKGNPFIFRTSFGQQTSMPKIANYMADELKAKKVAVLYVNNDFGKGGRDNFIKEMKARNIDVVADISTVIRCRRFRGRRRQAESGECRRDLRLHQRGRECPLPARSPQAEHHRAADRRNDAARPEGGRTRRSGRQWRTRSCRSHHRCAGPGDAAFKDKFNARFKYLPDHNGIKGYTGMYFVKYVTEKNKKFDSKAFADAAHGLTIDPKDEPGILMNATWDKNGDIDRESFLAEIVDGKQKIVKTLPKLNK